jgi:nicotinate-nucleotide pyrophosphorylase (carboxylating)
MNTEQLNYFVAQALQEDVGDGDHTTLSCISKEAQGHAILKIKQEGMLAGVDVAKQIFYHIDPTLQFIPQLNDGEQVKPGDFAFEVRGSVHTILTAERLVLNTMQRMSGIATITNLYVEKIKSYSSKLLDTRKTTPNFRMLEKEAVRIGGGTNHRFGLYDMILIKDNHIDYCGSIEKAIELAFEYVQKNKKGIQIEVETRNLEDVAKALATKKVDRIMFDNFTPSLIREAIGLIDGQCLTEASGGIHLENIESYAATGVDFISSGALIHQAQSIDLSLKAVIQ